MNDYYLGIDIGSVSISLVVIDDHNRINYSAYAFHNGRLSENLRKILKEINIGQVKGIGYTSSTPPILSVGNKVDTRVSYISAVKYFHPEARSLLIIGAEKFGRVTFFENREYRNYKSNSSCAAGTGNFLDQQAERLNISDIKEFSNLAIQNKGSFPKIASRCAVFAKTDLIHAQQEGYSLSEICDGLSYGVAKNIVDTVFHDHSFDNVVAAGGVALNRAVIEHLQRLTQLEIKVDEYANLYGAIGAAMNVSRDNTDRDSSRVELNNIIVEGKKEKKYYYPPLQLALSEYPDFDDHNKYEFRSLYFPSMKAVEVDNYYLPPKGSEIVVIMGVDIGSTSTKAVLLDEKKNVVAGFYTRTSGQPLHAFQVICEAIVDYSAKHDIKINIAKAGTTGSGRKFTGKIIGADLIIDEISAHARAAYEIDNQTDTIIEIGGQDSKFTVMRDGMVTFSIMNNVCAAGTGSFIEEQAKRLGCPINEYADRAENVRSPMASDRCTVFMERDLNHYLMAGYSAGEILAAVLHSTRENYLSKVAEKGMIGDKICFQGATAKNRALVAAFEQKLQKPVKVSGYCHLTGALGVALELHDQAEKHYTKFRGLDLYKKEIPVRTEVCELCTNHCKLRVAEIDGQVEAAGFLCGRDYNINKYVKNKTNKFQLIKRRREIYKFKPSDKLKNVTIGIPAGLHLFDEILFWRKFFDFLSIRTVTSEDYLNPAKDGKNIAGAEFCAPIAAMHGHVNYLMDKADYIFLPVYLDGHEESKTNKQYCYYTQFVSSVISVQKRFHSGTKLLTPLLKSGQGDLGVRIELLRMLKTMGLKEAGLIDVSTAYDKAGHYFQSVRLRWKDIFRHEMKSSGDISIMLLGRPYNVLSQAMNSHIPEIIEKNGVKTFFMDMLPYKKYDITKSEQLIKTMQWKFASMILYSAEIVARTDNLYPVLVTSFKCTPDSFVIEYFREMLDQYNKPYLILQLDEHDSAVGYETRIEAGIRSFRNHKKRNEVEFADINSEILNKLPGNTKSVIPKSQIWHKYLKSLTNEASHILKAHSIDFRSFSKLIQQAEFKENQVLPPVFKGSKKLKDRILLLPSWDDYVCPLLEAVLQNRGIDARLVNITDDSIHRSLAWNTGQCLPLTIIVQNSIDYIETRGLDPSSTSLWIPKSDLSCNLSMFPGFMKKLLENYGNGMERVSVYTGDIKFYDFSLSTAINAYLAYMFGGYLRKISCSLRPYEINGGTTNAIAAKALKVFHDAFLNNKPKEPVLKEIINDFASVELQRYNRPKAAIFGDIYVRDNDLMNQNLIETIEDNGGEVITTPYSEYMKIVVGPFSERVYKEGHYLNYVQIMFLRSLIPLVEDKYRKYFADYYDDHKSVSSAETNEWLNQFGLNIFQRGESIENILKIHTLIKQYPDLDLFIQTNPSYCCPSLVTEAMTSKIEELTGVPVVTLEYDGTSGYKNEDIIPYLKYHRDKVAEYNC